MILSVCFVVSVYHSCSGGEAEDYIKCEQIGGGSPIHVNNFSNLLVAGSERHTSTHAMYVLLLLMTAPM